MISSGGGGSPTSGVQLMGFGVTLHGSSSLGRDSRVNRQITRIVGYNLRLCSASFFSVCLATTA